jgi:hypothetical protein
MYMLVTYTSIYNMYKAYVSPGWEQQIMLLLSSLSKIYHLWTDCREDTAFCIVGCLAITRKRLPSGLGLARYQATSTPRRARHNIIFQSDTFIVFNTCSNGEFFWR